MSISRFWGVHISRPQRWSQRWSSCTCRVTYSCSVFSRLLKYDCISLSAGFDSSYAFNFAGDKFRCNESNALLMYVDSMTTAWPLLSKSSRSLSVCDQLIKGNRSNMTANINLHVLKLWHFLHFIRTCFQADLVNMGHYRPNFSLVFLICGCLL